MNCRKEDGGLLAGIKHPRLALHEAFGGISGFKRTRSPAAGRASGTIGVNLTAAGRQRGVPSTLCSGRLAPPSARGTKTAKGSKTARKPPSAWWPREQEPRRQGAALQKIVPHSGYLATGASAMDAWWPETTLRSGAFQKIFQRPLSHVSFEANLLPSSNSPSVINCHKRAV